MLPRFLRSSELSVFTRLEGRANRSRRAFSITGSNADFSCAAILYAIVISTVLHIAINTLDVLFLRVLRATPVFILLFFHAILFSVSRSFNAPSQTGTAHGVLQSLLTLEFCPIQTKFIPHPEKKLWQLTL